MFRIDSVVFGLVAGTARVAKEIERQDSDLARQMRRAAASGLRPPTLWPRSPGNEAAADQFGEASLVGF